MTHRDILFTDIVPWSGGASLIRHRLAEELRALPLEFHHDLDRRFAIVRRVSASIPQRQQSERNRLKHAARFIAETVWSPVRMLRVVETWRTAPTLAGEFIRQHRPRAGFITAATPTTGHLASAAQRTVINTGAFCPPDGSYTVDLAAGKLTVRDIVRRRGEFRAGDIVATFPLA